MPNPYVSMLSQIDFTPIGVVVLGGFAAIASVGVLIKGGILILRRFRIGLFPEPMKQTERFYNQADYDHLMAKVRRRKLSSEDLDIKMKAATRKYAEYSRG